MHSQTTQTDAGSTVDVYFTAEAIEMMFPASGDNGQVKGPTLAARAVAVDVLRVRADTVLEWRHPDVFNIRYGSSYVATAQQGNRKVRFHTSGQGTFKSGDDQ